MSFIDIEYRERCDSWGMSELQSHDYFELYFLLEGNRSLFFGDRMYSISGRAFCVIPPFAMHKTSGGSYKRININVSPELLSQRELEQLSDLSRGVAFSLDERWAELPIALLERAAELGGAVLDAEEKRRVTLSFLRAILYLLYNKPLKPIDHNAKTAQGASTAADTLILEVVSYLNASLREELTLDGIAERFYISKNTLSARFRAAMSCSVMQYLAFVRLSRAKELLSTTARSIDEIAALAGYSSANYFSLIFKKSVGISPREYRKTK